MHTVRKRVGTTAAALATALGTMFGMSAQAQADTAGPGGPGGSGAEGTSGTVEFSVFDTGGGLPRDESFQLKDLSDYGIPKRTTEKLAAGEAGEAGAQAPAAVAAPSGSFDVVGGGEWKDKDGWDAVMRRGYWNGANAGFGMTKIDQKHNLSLDAVKATTMYPRPTPEGKQQIAPTTYNYRTEVNHVECSGWWIFRSCRVTETLTVLAGIDYRKLDDGKAFGAVTAFCEGVSGRCPDWVRNAVNI
ncbi:hypothetical protein [Streptomyces sp. DSM 40750]|uniref:hypothetical protein n=1 Tax=Streptomyces sp. DSM 40750 TaxID=2801030 RepID=UPI00214CC902|nr:hypothetical protein [Streptomyces sp. DSM 40750]UUU24997.1 hypothetical protein JIX55_34735 [Streptomyces sp. DSM 40750]